MLLSIVSFLISTHNTDFHSSAPARIIHNQQAVYTTQKSPRIWEGHFSAEKFQNTPRDRVELLKIKKNIRTALKTLPTTHTRNLDTLEVRNTKHISRGMANDKKIILHTRSIDTEKELISIFIHEMGHVVDLGKLIGTSGDFTNFKDGKKYLRSDDPSIRFYTLSWKDATTLIPQRSKKDFVSGYAMSNCFEDFAESYLYYRLHGEKFRRKMMDSPILRKKYTFLRFQVFNGLEFQKDKPSPKTVDHIWDATLL